MRTLRVFQVTAMAAVLALANFSPAPAADHLDAPAIFIDGRMDINDTYIFQSPADVNTSVMIMTVNPFAGLLSPSTFNPSTAYDFQIDRNGDTLPDLTIRIRFSRLNRLTGKQYISVRYLFGTSDIVAGLGTTGDDIALRGGGTLRADTFDDPFFFDSLGFNNGFQFTGFDNFSDMNVSGIVIDYPRARLGGKNVSLNCVTWLNGVQIDRVGRPAINTVLIPTGRKDEFNRSIPFFDTVRFGDAVKARITDLSGDAAYAEAVTGILLPDVLTFDQTNAAGFLNGRRLEDDVIDTELSVLTNGALTTDLVNANDRPFLNTFPYLAPPH